MNGAIGGFISFTSFSTGGTSRVELFGSGTLSIALHNLPGVTIGSLEGDGQVMLGSNNLSIGSNNLSTTFRGVIQDAGSITKLGRGTLALSGPNRYMGGTTVSSGVLAVNNSTGSATGIGTVQVNAGILAGKGSIGGAVTIGADGGAGASLAPSLGAHRPVTITIKGALTFKANATYKYNLSSARLMGDSVVANGITIETGANFAFATAAGLLPLGTVFTAVDNGAQSAISGTFSNLADGAQSQTATIRSKPTMKAAMGTILR